MSELSDVLNLRGSVPQEEEDEVNREKQFHLEIPIELDTDETSLADKLDRVDFVYDAARDKSHQPQRPKENREAFVKGLKVIDWNNLALFFTAIALSSGLPQSIIGYCTGTLGCILKAIQTRKNDLKKLLELGKNDPHFKNSIKAAVLVVLPTGMAMNSFKISAGSGKETYNHVFTKIKKKQPVTPSEVTILLDAFLHDEKGWSDTLKEVISKCIDVKDFVPTQEQQNHIISLAYSNDKQFYKQFMSKMESLNPQKAMHSLKRADKHLFTKIKKNQPVTQSEVNNLLDACLNNEKEWSDQLKEVISTCIDVKDFVPTKEQQNHIISLSKKSDKKFYDKFISKMKGLNSK